MEKIIKFRCPECGCEKVASCLIGVDSQEIDQIFRNGQFTYKEINRKSADKFHCVDCDLIIINDRGFELITHREFVSWCIKHCE